MEIKETKEMVDFVIELANAVSKSMADGKIDFTDAGYLMAAMMVAGPAFVGAVAIPAELKDLSEPEAAELCAYVKAKLQLGDRAEEIVAASLATVAQIYKLVQVLKKATPAVPATGEVVPAVATA